MFKYLGGKSRISNYLINYMSAVRHDGMTWVEPFMGSGKVLLNVKGPRIGNDINHELIALFKAVQTGYMPPSVITEEQYKHMKENQKLYPDHLKGFVSFACAFGGMRWATYARDSKNTNYADLGRRNIIKNKKKLTGVKLYSCDYKELPIPDNSLIYCDPPYINTKGYGFDFNHDEFYDWCEAKAKDGHLVFISEYQAPKKFKIVWSKEVSVTVHNKKVNYKTENLYRVHDEQPFRLMSY
jgi:DNA adenine methylase